MSIPAAACLSTTRCTARSISRASWSLLIASPSSRRTRRSESVSLRGRLPTWVVKIRSRLRIMLRLKVFTQGEALRAVRRAGLATPVELIWLFEQRLVLQSPDHLPVFQQRPNFVGSNFQHRMIPDSLLGAPAESGIKEARIVYPEFSHRGIEGQHLGR